MNPIVSLLSEVYGLAASTKNFLYEAGLFDTVQVATPVISVGNLTVGGSGKTPLVLWILMECQKRGIKAGVVARGYKRKGTGIQKVDLTVPRSSRIFGDEPVEIARQFPEAPVYVGTPKWKVAQEISQREDLDLIIVDDGFQHSALKRNFDVVLVDLSRSPEFYELLPAGRGRESLNALQRADLIVGTRAQIANERTRNLFAKSNVVSSKTESVPPNDLVGGSKLLGVAGLGNPEALKKEWQALTDFVWTDFCLFPDHYDYQKKDAQLIQQKMKESGAEWIAVTEKDYVKLSEFSEIASYLRVISVSVKWLEEPQKIYEFFESLAR